ncbi:kinase-like domain-containing protein [Gigaspora rosea]|uniref:Kinase-like domain-containing protein n=1 Tax=Gigaspora rosea TaxID=44941 RepID=A0A397W8A3_9GLOM|nr:kinase-like domain-containing protein [Gigaspora rosea]
MKWKDKLNLLFSITSDLKAIHSQKIIHRDLHSDNILQDNLYSAYIADLGLSIPYLKQKDYEVYGVLPYIDPEVLLGKPYTTASDIYSFGIIMWEILYGRTVSCNSKLDDKDIQLQICYNDLRPPVNKEAPQCYVDLMKLCWYKESGNRPTAEELCKTFRKWQSDEQILTELHKSKLKLPEYTENSCKDVSNCGSKLISCNSKDLIISFTDFNG